VTFKVYLSPFGIYGQFFAEKGTFSLPSPFSSKFENAFAELHSLNFVPESLDKRLIIAVKSFFLYDRTLSHNTSVTDGRQTTDDNRTSSIIT